MLVLTPARYAGGRTWCDETLLPPLAAFHKPRAVSRLSPLASLSTPLVHNGCNMSIVCHNVVLCYFCASKLSAKGLYPASLSECLSECGVWWCLASLASHESSPRSIPASVVALPVVSCAAAGVSEVPVAGCVDGGRRNNINNAGDNTFSQVNH